MISKNKIEILNFFRKDIFRKITIRNLMKSLKKRSYQRIYEAVKELEKEDILDIEKIGNNSILTLKLTTKSIREISILDEKESEIIPNYEKLMSLKEITDYLIIVTGSYAKRTAKKSSDMDLVIIVPDDKNAKNIQRLIENITLLYYPPIHLYVFNKQDLKEMLLDKKENYGKEIAKSHLILKNAHIFYEIIKEAKENGYKS